MKNSTVGSMNEEIDIVKQGKALYVGLSNYNAQQLQSAAQILKNNKTPLLIVQPRYNMFNRNAETSGLFDAAHEVGAGIITYSPLAQGLLTNRYLNGIPNDSRAAKDHFLKKEDITEETISQIKQLQEIAFARNQSLAEMALCWNLRNDKVTSVLIGSSKKEQITDNVKIVNHLDFTKDELDAIEQILK